MNSQILKIVAVLMLIGSLILIAVAYRLGGTPQPTETAAPIKATENAYPIVTATRALQPGKTISASDVALATVTERPANSFEKTADVLGMYLVNAIAQGAPILSSDFVTGNPLVYSLKENERAIAIKVDEYVGVGGFIQPGDFVDIIAFVRGGKQLAKENQAFVVLRSVRVLTYGEELPAATGGKPAAKDEARKGKAGRNTAVVAIDAEQTPVLTLLENAAILRLALRPLGATDEEYQPLPVTLEDIVAPQSETAISEKSQGPIVEIFHGTQMEQVQYP